MEKIIVESENVVSKNVEKIGALFPNCITETRGEDGKLKKAINFETLQQMLSEDVIEGDESYEFTWVGKKASIAESNRPIQKTLRPCPEESVNWDTTENLYIEGDNLQVLKLLQKSYLGKIKMIYIDPPYNTGNDFVYNDNFTWSADEWDEKAGRVDDEGNRLFKNTDSNGRFHSDWCSMMYSRLLVAQTLLRDDGVIFISIDDNEVGNLRLLCDQVFGSSNLINSRSLIYHIPDGSNKGFITRAHEYVLPYAKNIKNLKPFIRPDGVKLSSERCTNTPTKDNPTSSIIFKKGLRYDGDSAKISGIIGDKEPIEIVGEMIFEDGKLVNDVELRSSWRNKDQIVTYMRDGIAYDESGQEVIEIFFEKSGKPKYTKRLIHYPLKSVIPNVKDTLYDDLAKATSFENPKPVELIQLLTSLICNDGDIVLDFFSGSGTTANSVFCHNLKMQKSCNFILIQLDEDLDVSLKNVTGKAKTHLQSMISYLDSIGKPHLLPEIGKERIRRAGKKIKQENPLTTTDLDIGFRVLKLDDWNKKDVEKTPAETSQADLLAFTDNLRDDRSDLDLLFGCLIDSGLELTKPITSEDIEGCAVYSYNEDWLIGCFAENVPNSVIRKIASRRPRKAIFRDSSFADSPSKINVTEVFKMISPDTQLRVI